MANFYLFYKKMVVFFTLGGYNKKHMNSEIGKGAISRGFENCKINLP